jgi:hypothetical protein
MVVSHCSKTTVRYDTVSVATRCGSGQHRQTIFDAHFGTHGESLFPLFELTINQRDG